MWPLRLDSDCLVESRLLLCVPNLEVALLILGPTNGLAQIGMPTVQSESCCLALRDLLSFTSCKRTDLNGMLTVSIDFLGLLSSPDLVSVQTLMLCRWAVWSFALANHCWCSFLV